MASSLRMRAEERGGVGAAARRLFAPVDNSGLVLFRMAFGLLVALECGGAIATGWVRANLIEPTVRFPIIGFEWVRPLPGQGMHAYYAVMAVLGVCVMLGWRYRLALAAFAALWAGAYVMQTVSYNNHYWLILLLALLLLVMPAHAWASLDARREPELRGEAAPRWCLFLLKAQVACVYGFAALAKLDADWLAARPLALWLGGRADWPGGSLIAHPWTAHVLAWGGLLFDGLVVPLLAWRRTRLLAFGLAVAFHLTNSYLFRIGVFPYLGIALCLPFFDGDALRRRFLPSKPPVAPARAPEPPLAPRRRLALVGIGAWLAVQLALPLRHLLYPGPVEWTEEGHRMSWRMMLRTKAGHAQFELRDPATDERWTVRLPDHLTEKQAERVAVRPDLLWQFAQYLAERRAAERGVRPEVRVRARVSLNGRPPRTFVDPEVDLAAAEWCFLGANRWIAPLEE